MTRSSGKCEFCSRPGSRMAGPEDGLKSDLYVCNGCKKLLSSPSTALPLIRGHLTLTLRGTMPEKRLRRAMEPFMQRLASWKKRPAPD